MKMVKMRKCDKCNVYMLLEENLYTREPEHVCPKCKCVFPYYNGVELKEMVQEEGQGIS